MTRLGVDWRASAEDLSSRSGVAEVEVLLWFAIFLLHGVEFLALGEESVAALLVGFEDMMLKDYPGEVIKYTCLRCEVWLRLERLRR